MFINYFKKWMQFCDKHHIWFSCFSSGDIEMVTMTIECYDCYPDKDYDLGTKEAYEWLVECFETGGEGRS